METEELAKKLYTVWAEQISATVPWHLLTGSSRARWRMVAEEAEKWLIG